MNTKRIGRRADYILNQNGDLARTAQGNAVLLTYIVARDAQQQLQAGWAGAYVAGAFRKFPWLESMTIELKVSGEHDDNGGTYRSINVRVSDVSLRTEVASHEDAVADGQFASDTGAALVKTYFNDVGDDLYDAFPPDCEDGYDIAVKVERQSVAQLLMRDEVNGKEAFVRLFPAYADAAGHSDTDVARELTAAELEALSTFRSQHGRKWKAALRHCWETSMYPITPDGQVAVLQGLRNARGPVWLAKLRLSK